jgi:hypothetical protein
VNVTAEGSIEQLLAVIAKFGRRRTTSNPMLPAEALALTHISHRILKHLVKAIRIHIAGASKHN